MSSADDIEEISLEVIPTGDDRGVQIFITEDLQEKLLLKQFNMSIKRVGMFLYIATLAMAQKSEYLIKVQNALLDNLKLNDTSAVMLQSFQSGAVNIVEKLKVAYLYLLDGFPEFAKTDIEAIGKDINTMKDQAEKTKRATAKCVEDVVKIEKQVHVKLKEVEQDRKNITTQLQPKKVERHDPPSYQNDQQQTNKSSQPSSSCECCWGCCHGRCSCCRDCNGCCNCCSCCDCCDWPWFGWPWYGWCTVSGNDDGDGLQSNTNLPVTNQPERHNQDEVNKKENLQRLQKLGEEAELFQLTLTVLKNASVILNECGGFLDDLLGVVKQWYTENKEVVSPSMAENIRRTEGMSEAEMKAYWESLMFRKEVQKFYTRWVALKLYCESTRKNLKQIRAETEAWYVDNPRPRDAVQKAWAIARNADDEAVDKIVKSRDIRIADQSAKPAITS